MATKKGLPKTSSDVKTSRTRKERTFPALTFEEALKLAQAIQDHASGQKVRRLTLFEKLNQDPGGAGSRRLITASSQYGLTKGSYNADYLELTPEGKIATDEDSGPAKRLQARFDLAIMNQVPFAKLYDKVKGMKLPAKEVMADYLSEAGVEEDEKAECIDTFTVNVKFLGLLRTIAGAERLVPIEQGVEEAPNAISQGRPRSIQHQIIRPIGKHVERGLRQ